MDDAERDTRMAAELRQYRPYPVMSPLSVGLALLLITCQVTGVGSACAGNVAKKAEDCFEPYRQDLPKIQTSPQRLCCGLDVETFRSYCTSFKKSINCIRTLKVDCPRASGIDAVTRNQLQGAESTLRDLCIDDTIFETYARHQTCLTIAGEATGRCLQSYLNMSNSVRVLTTVNTRSLDEFCSDMRGALQCVQANVRNLCSASTSEAVSLATKLVKAMVRDSSRCDYSVVTKAPVSRQGQPSPSSHDGSWQGPASASVQHQLSSSALLLVCVTVVTRTIFMSS